MYSTLKLWIAQSISWQTFIDFRLPKEKIANYNFIEDFDDFYLSLISNAFDILEQPVIEEQNKNELLQIARGLEIYSLELKRDFFSGVNIDKNILFSAGFYYISDFSASALLLSEKFEISNYNEPIDIFISCFLRRKFSKNKYCNLLNDFIISGNVEYLDKLYLLVKQGLSTSIQTMGLSYLSYLLAERILDKFRKNNIWYDLLQFNSIDYWIDFITVKTEKSLPIWDFFPSQRKAIFNNIFDTKKTTTIQMPTSAGKTAICELIIYDEFKKNPSCKILYLAPFRALASELKQSLGGSLRKHGIKVKSIYGGNIPTQEEKIAIENTNLLISTPEKFIAIEDIFPELVNDFTTIICDEGHLIDDENRGLSYELLLTRLKNDKRFVFISAIIPNIDVINTWLGGTHERIITSQYRPTKLDFAFLKRKRTEYYLDINPTKSKPDNYFVNKFIDIDDENKEQNEYRFLNNKTGNLNKYPISAKTTSVTSALKSLPSGTVALFAASKGEHTGVRGLVNEIIKQIDYKLKFPNPIDFANQNQISLIFDYFSIVFGTSFILTKAIQYGFLFHYGDLPQLIREIIEEALRKGDIRLVVCTNTLAEGVNLPIKTMVLYSITRNVKNSITDRWEKEEISLRDLKNLVGRAGRAGQETQGLIIAINGSEYEYLKKLIEEDGIENVNGFLYNLIEALDVFIENKKEELSNELFERLGEDFLQLIDLIDKSVIHLLDNGIKIDEIDKKLNHLIENTLTFHQSNPNQKAIVKKVFKLRSEKVIPFIKQDKFKYLKLTGLDIREFENIENTFDLTNDLLLTLENPLDTKWLDYILDDLIFNLNNIQVAIDNFGISKINLRQGIIYWLNGYWYEDISAQLQVDINKALPIVNSLICYRIQNTLASILKYAESVFAEKDIELSNEVKKWTQYLLYGVNSHLKLDLIELGLNDRIVVNKLSDLIQTYSYEHVDYKQLKIFILMNEKELRLNIKGEIPELSMNLLNSFVEKLKY